MSTYATSAEASKAMPDISQSYIDKRREEIGALIRNDPLWTDEWPSRLVACIEIAKSTKPDKSGFQFYR